MKSMFITGSTGFVGNYFVRNIHHENIKYIFLLIRDIKKFFELKESIPQAVSEKIIPIFGSIEQDRLGLNNTTINILKENVGIVYHIAAEVNHIKSCEQLYNPNVKSVETIINIFDSSKIVINFISTLGSANNIGNSSLIKEEFLNDKEPELKMGYLVSKQKAELYLAKIKNKVKVNIFRLGYVSSDSVSGKGLYKNNQFMLFIKSCLQMKLAPKINREFNFTPVDFVGEFMNIEDFYHEGLGVYNLFNYKETVTWLEIVEHLNERGCDIKVVDMNLWQQSLLNYGRNIALFRFVLLYRKKDAGEHILRFGKNIKSYDYTKSKCICEKHNLYPPAIKFKYLDKIFDYLNEVGFINTGKIKG